MIGVRRDCVPRRVVREFAALLTELSEERLAAQDARIADQEESIRTLRRRLRELDPSLPESLYTLPHWAPLERAWRERWEGA